jgi:hypothetical protein
MDIFMKIMEKTSTSSRRRLTNPEVSYPKELCQLLNLTPNMPDSDGAMVRRPCFGPAINKFPRRDGKPVPAIGISNPQDWTFHRISFGA